MPKHYVAMAGLHGYMPNCCTSCETKGQAAEYLGQIHELSANKIRLLRRDMYLELDLATHGNEYCEIQECDCADADCHNDT